MGGRGLSGRRCVCWCDGAGACAQTGAATAATATTNHERHTIPASVSPNAIDGESSSKDSPDRERGNEFPALLSQLGAGKSVRILSR